MPMSRRPWVVVRLDEAAVSSPAGWATVGEIVAAHLDAGLATVVACPPLSGVTALLEKILAAAPLGLHETPLRELRERHEALARALGLRRAPSAEPGRGMDPERSPEADADLIHAEMALLERLTRGISLTREVTPRLRAQVLAQGALMASRLGAAYLHVLAPGPCFIDPCRLLEADPSGARDRSSLQALCGAEAISRLLEVVESAGSTLLVTGGGIAATPDGHVHVLGAAGTDIAASLIAAGLGALRVEAWGETPGLYSSDPRRVPNARLLRHLDYDEAQELASVEDATLHPACLAPLRRHGIPLELHCTRAPELEGTCISSRPASAEGHLKAVIVRSGVTLVSLDTLGMWHQVGFLAAVFACFARHGLSVDLVATSEANVTVSLDVQAEPPDAATLDALVADLSDLCVPGIIRPCATVSLVGTRIRSILHRLGPVLELFEEQHVHLVSQAASDLNVTFVVDEDQAEKLMTRLHALLLSGLGDDDVFGPTWQQQFQEGEAPAAQEAPAWWQIRRDDLLALAGEETPLYVYDEASLRGAASALLAMSSVDRIFYAIKANPCPEILAIFHEMGLGFECVSPGEVERVRTLFPGIEGDRILFTPNFASAEEYRAGFEAGIHVTLDNIEPLETWPEVFAGRSVLVRLDPGEGGGHHRHVRTAGAQSKFGVSEEQLDRLAALVERVGVTVVGLHAHAGSGIRDPRMWIRTAGFLGRAAARFPGARILDLGGGLGVPEKAGDAPLDLAALDAGLAGMRDEHPGLAIWLEPGRFLVARAGVLLARVTQRKTKGRRSFVGVDAGMNSLIRPALYGAYHPIVNLSRLEEPFAVVADVVGPICETGDVLGHERRLPETLPGDVLLVATAGAYGRAMSSSYNLRRPAEERLLPAAP